jgi:uncharacterized protein
MALEIVDAWLQHASRELLDQPMFDSLRRRAHDTFAPGELPLEWTIQAMDEAGVSVGNAVRLVGPQGTSYFERYDRRMRADTLRTGS